LCKGGLNKNSKLKDFLGNDLHYRAPSRRRFLRCTFALLQCAGKEFEMSVAFAPALSPPKTLLPRARRARFGTAWAMAGLVVAGVVNLLWVAALGYGFSLLVL
jgi:hypothetical protein